MAKLRLHNEVVGKTNRIETKHGGSNRTMYICKTCGAVFSTPAYEKSVAECPDCKSRKITEANYCRTCHDYFVGSPNEAYCPDCILSAEDQLREAIEKWVDPDYIELLKDEYPDIGYIMGDENG